MMYLQLVADVDDQRVGHGVDGHPAAVALHLQAGDAVLEQERDGIGVLVPRQPVGELRLRARRVVVHCHVLCLPPHGRHHLAPLQAQALRYGLQQPQRQRPRLRRVGAHHLPVGSSNHLVNLPFCAGVIQFVLRVFEFLIKGVYCIVMILVLSETVFNCLSFTLFHSMFFPHTKQPFEMEWSMSTMYSVEVSV